MDKKIIFGVIVVLISLLFLTEQFYIGGGMLNLVGGSNVPQGTNVTGTSTFNGTIRTYDPILYIASNESPAVVAQLRQRSDVSDVTSNPPYYIIKTQTRDDVFPIAEFLRSQNVTSISIANIEVTSAIPVHTAFGDVNATVPNGIVRVPTEPLLDSGNQVTVSLVAVVNDNQLIDTNSEIIQVTPVQFQLQAVVAGLDHKEYSYLIPWDQRNTLGNLSAYGGYNYSRVDSIIFNPELNASTIMAKKQFTYITYIDSGSAQVDPSFDNSTLLATNFQDVGYALPPSSLIIYSNDTPSIPFNATVQYSYLVAPGNSTDYDFSLAPFLLTTSQEYNVNDTFEINVSGMALGSKIVSVTRVDLPS